MRGSPRAAGVVRTILIGLVLAVLVSMGLLLRQSVDRVRELDRQVAEAMQQVESANEQIRHYAVQFERASELADQARRESAQAAESAQVAAGARARAEAEAVEARETALKSEEQSRQSEAELNALKQRREQELDRMHDALSRIARTRRTGSGMIVELNHDSFQFDFDKATLRPENRELLSRIAGVLLASNGYRLYVHGHTDDVGTEDYNQGLSERRAHAVAAYLQTCGVDSGVMATQGFGKSSPRVQGSNPAAREKNRRVEIAVVDSIIDYKGIVQAADSR